jgi:hypothetical protein
LPLFEPGEKTVFVETARHKNTFGNLYLTDTRLIFEHESGIFSKRVYVTLDLPLEGVANVAVEGTLAKRLIVYARKGFVSSFPVRLDFSVKDPVHWKERILSTSESRRKRIPEKEIIKEKEVIVKVRCSYCNRLYDETLDKCPNCGGQV